MIRRWILDASPLIPLKGSLGIIVWAKKEKVIDNVKPYFDELIKAGLRIEPRLINDLINLISL